jgi:hypothetical protein
MMTYAEIEEILGSAAVSAVEVAIAEACKAGEGRGDRERTPEAVRELLVAMLAALIITPTKGATSRANDTAARLLEIAAEALR